MKTGTEKQGEKTMTTPFCAFGIKDETQKPSFLGTPKVHNSVMPMVAEAERTIKEACKYFGLKVQPEEIIVTIQSKGRMNALGWFGSNHWCNSNPDKKLHEMNLSAEHITRGIDVGETILHELAHAENHAHGIKDCAGRVHNRRFKVQAERLGLKVAERHKSLGFAFTSLDEKGTSFLKGMNFNESVFDVGRLSAKKRKGVGSPLVKACCPQCGYTIRVTRKWLDIAPPTCTICKEEFEEKD